MLVIKDPFLTTATHLIFTFFFLDLYQIKEIRERVKSRVIKDFSTYEKGEDSNQLYANIFSFFFNPCENINSLKLLSLKSY